MFQASRKTLVKVSTTNALKDVIPTPTPSFHTIKKQAQSNLAIRVSNQSREIMEMVVIWLLKNHLK